MAKKRGRQLGKLQSGRYGKVKDVITAITKSPGIVDKIVSAVEIIESRATGHTADGVPMVSVKSSNLQAVGIDIFNGELIIDFKSGSTYIYGKLKPKQLNDLYMSLLTAPSVGKEFNNIIRNTSIPFRRV